MKHILTLLTIVIVNCSISTAATYTAINSGNWTSTGTWQGGLVPPNTIGANNVHISSGITVTLDANLILNNSQSFIELKTNASIIDGSTANFISISNGNIKGTSCSIDIDSIYYDKNALADYNGNITVETFADANSIYAKNVNLTVKKTLRLFNGGGDYSCKIDLTSNPRTTIVFAGGKLSSHSSNTIDLSKPYNVKYEAHIPLLDYAPEIKGVGLTDMELDYPYAVTWGDYIRCNKDITIRGKLMLTEGILLLTGKLTLANNATIDATQNGGLRGTMEILIQSSQNDIGRIQNGRAFFIKKLTMDSPNPNAKITLGYKKYRGVIHIDEMELIKGKIVLDSITIHTSSQPIKGGSNNSYIITDKNVIAPEFGSGGIGFYKMQVNKEYLFPIGTAQQYAPIKVTLLEYYEEYISAVVTNGCYYTDSYPSPPPNFAIDKPVVNATWRVYTTVPSFTRPIKCTVEPMWTANMEVNGFNRNRCYIPLYGSNMKISSAGSNNNFYSLKTSGPITSSKVIIVDEISEVSIESLMASNLPLTIYPNPATEKLNINYSGNNATSIVIYNMAGSAIKTTSIIKGVNSIDVSELSNGVYYIQLKSKDVTTTHKFVKR